MSGPIKEWATINGAEVYYGTAYIGQPSWTSFINSGTTNHIGSLSNSGSVCLIFIPIANRIMCFSFGHTASKINVLGFERDFGLKVVLNTVNPLTLKSVDSKIIDTVVMNRKPQLNKENGIHDFGFEVNKDLLRGVAGKPTKKSFASTVSGSDTLAINCDVSAQSLNTKVASIFKEYNCIAYKKITRGLTTLNL